MNYFYAVSPDPVRNVKNISSDSESITLTWEFGFNGNANISGVNITYYARDFFINDTQYMMISTTSLQTSLTLLNLQPQTVYFISIRVRNSVSSEVGLSPPVNITVKTKQRETKRKVSNSGTIMVLTITSFFFFWYCLYPCMHCYVTNVNGVLFVFT